MERPFHPSAFRFIVAVFTYVYVCWATQVAAATLVNPSFEDDGEAFVMNNTIPERNPLGWNFTSTAAAFEASLNGMITSGSGILQTDGLYEAELFAAASTFSTANSISLSQMVDLTNVSEIIFDAATVAIGDIWDNQVKASFLIDGIEYWSSQSNGTFLNLAIDTSGISSNRTIEFKLDVLSPVSLTTANDFLIDNLRITTIPIPAAVWLFASGLLGMIGIARRKKAA